MLSRLKFYFLLLKLIMINRKQHKAEKALDAILEEFYVSGKEIASLNVKKIERRRNIKAI